MEMNEIPPMIEKFIRELIKIDVPQKDLERAVAAAGVSEPSEFIQKIKDEIEEE